MRIAYQPDNRGLSRHGGQQAKQLLQESRICEQTVIRAGACWMTCNILAQWRKWRPTYQKQHRRIPVFIQPAPESGRLLLIQKRCFAISNQASLKAGIEYKKGILLALKLMPELWCRLFPGRVAVHLEP